MKYAVCDVVKYSVLTPPGIATLDCRRDELNPMKGMRIAKVRMGDAEVRSYRKAELAVTWDDRQRLTTMFPNFKSSRIAG